MRLAGAAAAAAACLLLCARGATGEKAPLPLLHRLAQRNRSLADAASTPRTTWNGCACKKEWDAELGAGVQPCKTYCCNPDEDERGDWCMVEDAECEAATWGRCRPEGLVPKACRDEPKGWLDLEGEDCGAYGSQGYCTLQGAYGMGWEEGWGTFEENAKDGVSAKTACCNCGGGKTPTGCADLPGWVDKEGDGCESYVAHQWCNSTGGAGEGWHEDWGSVAAHATNGVSAASACCGCGGGGANSSLASPAPAPAPGPPEAAGQATAKRRTWNQCECKEHWELVSGGKCDSSCCNVDGDPLGDWCVVVDEQCEGQNWGYCQPPDAVLQACRDDPPGWLDSEGEGCHIYGAEGFCTPTGEYGAAWQEEFGTWETYANKNRTARTACCNCGGGLPISGCADETGWKDVDGDTCADYVTYLWCTSNGQYGRGWHEEWGQFANFSTGRPANAACCGCGGGTVAGAAPVLGAPAPPASSAAAAPSPAPPPPAAAAPSPARTSWNGCPCKREWTLDADVKGSCSSYCCNPGGQALGDLCVLEDANCEESVWAYCSPLTSAAPACTDDPPGWKDSDGEDCKMYAADGFCTSDGHYGPTWVPDWGTFQTYAVGGRSAATACCSCGGGARYAGCADQPDWTDADKDTCASYVAHQWCNISGGYGLGWHKEWGTFADHTATSPPTVACCGCGGGKPPGTWPAPQPAPAPTPAPSSSGPGRITWNGCKCKEKWALETDAGKVCETFCCSLDGDLLGDWCAVEDPDCEDETWGYCKPAGVSTQVCVDDPPDWKDTDGEGCAAYYAEGYCTLAGGYGPGWQRDWGDFDVFAVGGRTGKTACCNCGGGKRPTDCTNEANWKDQDGMTCDTYVQQGWCTSWGGYGPGWHEEWGKFVDYAAVPAPKACCGCGRGTNVTSVLVNSTWDEFWDEEDEDMEEEAEDAEEEAEDEEEQEELESAAPHAAEPPPDNFGSCVDAPGWRDVDGDDCQAYLANAWCTVNGGFGMGWMADWGPFPSGSNGEPAATACCACGKGAADAAKSQATPEPAGKSSVSTGIGVRVAGGGIALVALVAGLCWYQRSRTPTGHQRLSGEGTPYGRKYGGFDDL